MQIRRSVGANPLMFPFTSAEEGLTLDVETSTTEVGLLAVTSPV